HPDGDLESARPGRCPPPVRASAPRPGARSGTARRGRARAPRRPSRSARRADRRRSTPAHRCARSRRRARARGSSSRSASAVAPCAQPRKPPQRCGFPRAPRWSSREGVSHGGVTGYRGLMAVALRQSRRFDASSPVTRYWLANCVGFSLSGGGRGTVERVVAEVNPYDPSFLEVRTGHRRVRRLPTSAVIAVVPQEKVLVVDHRRRLTPDRRRDVSLRLRWSVRVLQRVLVVGLGLLAALAVELWELGRRAWSEGSPVVARTSRKGGSEAARLVRSVPWQSYGRAARSATTRLSEARSSRSSRRPTTSSGRRKEKSSTDEARTTSST